ncbi:MAG: 3-hydroxyacyl-ACP dehydratase [Chitinophagaceae bacterium]|nr:MAG: 3-hydroxyacyl-ACP dehydratase [Chitinophagaceae bacterium]
MLMNNLYTEIFFESNDQEINAKVLVEKNHPIFDGHFPEQPILPGVCMMQLIKEIVEKAVSKKIILKESTSCKFLNMLDPTQNNSIDIAVNYSISDSNINVNAVLKSYEMVILKMSSVYQ